MVDTKMHHPGLPQGRTCCPTEKSKISRVSNYQFFKGLPYLSQIIPFHRQHKSGDWVRQGYKDPAFSTQCGSLIDSTLELLAQLTRLCQVCIATWLLSLFNPTSSPFPSEVLVPNKLFTPQTPSQYLLTLNPTGQTPHFTFSSTPFCLEQTWELEPFALSSLLIDIA